MHKAPAHPHLLDVPVVAAEHPLGDALFPRLPAEYVDVAAVRRPRAVVPVPVLIFVFDVGPLGHEPEPDQLRVPLQADVEPADPRPEPEHAGAAPRRQVQHLLDAQARALALPVRHVGPLPHRHGPVVRDEGGLARGLEHAGAVPAADVGAQPDAHPGVEEPADGRLAARQRRVAAGAVGDARAAPGDERDLGVREVDGVAEDGAGAEEAVAVVHVGVAVALGEHGLDEGELGRVLGDVGLHGEFLDVAAAAVGAPQGAEAGHALAGAGGGEARGEDGGDEGEGRVDGADVVDGGAGAGEGLVGGLVAVVGRVHVAVVHADAADEGALAGGEAEVGEQVGGLDVEGGVVGGRRGAVGQRAADAARVHAARLGQGRQGGLHRERVLVQPVQQRRLAEDARVRVLRRVDVGVWVGGLWSVT